MKKLVTLLLFAIPALTMLAAPSFEDGKTYQIACRQYPGGCVADGNTNGQTTPLYYLTAATTDAASYWIFTEESDGFYSIKNAGTGQYITYDGVYEGSDRRYISMTDELNGDYSLWTISYSSDVYFTIANAAETTHVWDVRNNSYVVGTHTSNNGNNQYFSFTDEGGNQVTDVEPEEPTVTEDGVNVSGWLSGDANSLSGWENEKWWVLDRSEYVNGSASISHPFIEYWTASNQGWGTLSDTYLQQSLTLPAGTYTLKADFIAVQQASNTPAKGIYFFAGEQEISIGTYNEKPQTFSIEFTVDSEQTINIGVRIESTTANWVAMDNLKLFYQGTEEDVIAYETESVRNLLTAKGFTEEEIDAKLAATEQTLAALEALREAYAYYPDIDPLSRCANGITIAGRTPVYVASLNTYLCSIPLDSFQKDFDAVVAYESKDGFGDIVIDQMPVGNGETFTFANVEAQKTYELSISDTDGNTTSIPLTFTSLPVVRINGSFSNEYSQGYFLATQPDKTKAELLNMKAKWRGGITNSDGKNKRNYHVKLQDPNGIKLDRRYFGLRKDNSWILESCQVDMSRIRNRVLTDIWNAYCTMPYYYNSEPEALSGTRGNFVELVLNDDYRGIYCMTENMDRKQMKLAKYDETTNEIHGELWKSKDWSYSVFMGHYKDNNYYPGYSPTGFDNYSEAWDSYNVKYPDIDDVNPTDWQVLYDAVNFVCTASDEEFKAQAAEYFDLPVLIDYYILMETILSTDNHGKNMFFAVYDKQVDKKITFGVWDMDATSGQRWSDAYFHADFLGPEQDYAEFITNYEHGDYNLFRRMRDVDPENFNLKVRKRYRELRDTELKTENILKRFKTYFDEFATAGADQREYAKWNGNSDISGLNLDFENEYEYLTDWFTRRMNYLDETRFDISSLPVNGDANGDGVVSIADVTALVNQILGKSQTNDPDAADVNTDGDITIADVTGAVNLILRNTSAPSKIRIIEPQ